MQFVDSRPDNNFYKNQNTNKKQSIIMPFSASYRRTVQINQNNIIPQIAQTTPQTSKQEKKMKWGEPTWFLFHTLAEKVKEEKFQNIRIELLNTIRTICSNLPCPDCANHASEYMKKINFASIRTKQDLKLMLFQFHNVVNQRKNFPLFSINDLDSKYANANTMIIIQNFMFYFQDKNHSIRMISNDIFRARISEQLKTWFNNNIHNFNL
jgi:hypothetical protein